MSEILIIVRISYFHQKSFVFLQISAKHCKTFKCWEKDKHFKFSNFKWFTNEKRCIHTQLSLKRCSFRKHFLISLFELFVQSFLCVQKVFQMCPKHFLCFRGTFWNYWWNDQEKRWEYDLLNIEIEQQSFHRGCNSSELEEDSDNTLI